MDKINPEILKIFAFFGLMVIVGCVALVLYAFFEWVKEKIGEMRWKHRYKHRFNRPPLAKCYCVDCKWWSKGSNECKQLGNGWCTPDSGFCYRAEPKDLSQVRKENKQ